MDLSVEELTEWEAFYLLEPFGEEWRQTALVAAMIASNQMFNGKHSPDKFMPVQKTVVRKSPEQVASALSGFFSGLRKQAQVKPKKKRNG